MRALPEELKNIKPPTTVGEFFEVLEKLPKFSNKVEAFELKLAKQFFTDNFSLFSVAQVHTALEHSYFKTFDGKFYPHVFSFSRTHDIPFPILLPGAIKNFKEYEKNQYLQIINKHDNKEQIDFFLKEEPKLINTAIEYDRFTPGKYLFEKFLEKKPQYIFANKHWSQERVLSWFDDNKNHLLALSTHYRQYQDKASQTVKNIFLDKISDYFISRKDKKDWSEKLTNMLMVGGHDFWELLESKSPGFLKDTMHKTYESKEYSLNYIQIISANIVEQHGISYLLNTVKPYLDFLLEPIEENVYGYKKQSDAFEVALRHKKWSIFVPFAFYYDKIDDTQKQIMTAAAFTYLQESSPKSYYLDWAKKTILESSCELLTKYQHINIGKISDLKLLADIDIIINAKQLECTLEVKAPEKRRKL